MKKYLLWLLMMGGSLTTHAQSNRQYTKWYRDSVLHSYIGTDYSAYDLHLSNNKEVTSRSAKGKMVFINFWFGGCAACIEEFDALNKLYDSVKNDPNIVFLSITPEPKERMFLLMQKYSMHYPVASVSRAVCNQLNYSSGFPATLVIDKAGKIVLFRVEGYSKKLADKVFLSDILPRLQAQY